MLLINDFFSHPFFIIASGISVITVVVGFFTLLYLTIKGVLPVWYRLGIGLSKRKIAIFATDEFESLKDLLVDSGLFNAKNIIKVGHMDLKKAEDTSLLLVHYSSFESKLDDILSNKKDAAALIVYAPQNEGFIKKSQLAVINEERNSTIVNMRGRLLNDILLSMITTSYKKR